MTSYKKKNKCVQLTHKQKKNIYILIFTKWIVNGLIDISLPRPKPFLYVIIFGIQNVTRSGHWLGFLSFKDTSETDTVNACQSHTAQESFNHTHAATAFAQ